MREELDCLLRENIRLHVSDSSDTVSHVGDTSRWHRTIDEGLPQGQACAMKIHHLSTAEVYSSLQSTPSGLSPEEAKRRMAEYGRNEVALRAYAR